MAGSDGDARTVRRGVNSSPTSLKSMSVSRHRIFPEREVMNASHADSGDEDAEGVADRVREDVQRLLLVVGPVEEHRRPEVRGPVSL
jgi:hypothetical protein